MFRVSSFMFLGVIFACVRYRLISTRTPWHTFCSNVLLTTVVIVAVVTAHPFASLLLVRWSA